MRCEICGDTATLTVQIPRCRGLRDLYRLCRGCVVEARPFILKRRGTIPDLPAPPQAEEPEGSAPCHHCGAGVRKGLPLCGKCRAAMRATVKHHAKGGRVGAETLGARAALSIPAEVAEGWGPAGLRELRAALGGGA